ncbi:hypothetical protein ACPOLB_15355 [Rubrivivax sp. RP6-9]|uniref:hypothetical protein n=1 Tax=Rubrivivax sp. RP6-9 TaxID=3415750 RepID=UPI003CC6618A
MRFQESHEGDYRIYVGALDAPRGDGYIAAVVVNRVRGVPGTARQREAFRDDSLACGHRWPDPDEALHYALSRARELIRSRSQMLAC